MLREPEDLGGVFAPLPDRGLIRPAYTWGQKQEGAGVRSGTFLWQCPVSAIPDVVFQLLDLWWEFRLLRLMPERWTPLLRVAFLVFESEYRGTERHHDRSEEAAAMAVGALVKFMGGWDA